MLEEERRKEEAKSAAMVHEINASAHRHSDSSMKHLNDCLILIATLVMIFMFITS